MTLSSIAPDPALQERVREGIDRLSAFHPVLWKQLCDGRDSRLPDAFGNLVEFSPRMGSVDLVLRGCDWSMYEDGPELVVIRTFDLQGWMGVEDLRTISPYRTVILRAEGEVVIPYIYQNRGPKVPFVTLSFLKSEDGEMIVDFGAGPPRGPSSFPRPSAGPFSEQTEVVAATALQMGLRWARCEPPIPL